MAEAEKPSFSGGNANPVNTNMKLNVPHAVTPQS